MDVTLVSVGIFTVGVLVQFFLLLNLTNVTRHVLWQIAGTLLLSAVFTFFITGPDATLPEYLIVYCFCTSIIMAWTFKDRIVPSINEIALVLLNLVVIYLFLQQQYEWPFLLILGVLTIGCVLNAIIPIKPNSAQKSVLFVWYFLLGLLLIVGQMDIPKIFHLQLLLLISVALFGSLVLFDEIYQKNPTVTHKLSRLLYYFAVLVFIGAISYYYIKTQINIDGLYDELFELTKSFQFNSFDLFTLGMIFGLVMTNVTYIAGLVPYKGKYGTRAQALARVEEHVRFLVQRYDDTQLKPRYGMLLVGIVILFLTVNIYFDFVSDSIITTIALLISSGTNYYLFHNRKAEPFVVHANTQNN